MPKKKPDTKWDVTRWGRTLEYETPTGVTTRLYNIATAAAAIGRTPQTLRKWEISGLIPNTPFRVGGNRMYADEHIDALVECMEEARLRPGVSITNTTFSSHLYKKFDEIYTLFFGNTEGSEGNENTENEGE